MRGKGFQELLKRTHGQNQGGGWKQGREVGLAVVGGGGEMQTTVIEQLKKKKLLDLIKQVYQGCNIQV